MTEQERDFYYRKYGIKYVQERRDDRYEYGHYDSVQYHAEDTEIKALSGKPRQLMPACTIKYRFRLSD